MVVNKENIISQLMKLGFSEYEAKVYLSLVRDTPATAYEIGKTSGVPSSKVYEVLKKLLEKGIVSITDGGRTKQYISIPPEEFLRQYKNSTDRMIDSLMSGFAQIKGNQDFSYILNITDYDYLIHKAKHTISNASNTVLLSIWKEEFALIQEELRDAVNRKVKVATVHFGLPKVKIGQIYPHPIEDTIYQEKGGRGLIVVSDEKEVILGTIFRNRRVEGAWSINRGFVTLAEDYIKHDIYVMKIVRRFDRKLKEWFGDRYARLRDIFTDSEDI